MSDHMRVHLKVPRDTDDQGSRVVFAPLGSSLHPARKHVTFTEPAFGTDDFYTARCRCGWHTPFIYAARAVASSVGVAHVDGISS